MTIGQAYAMLLIAGILVFTEFSVLACHAIGTTRASKFEACQTYYGVEQDGDEWSWEDGEG